MLCNQQLIVLVVAIICSLSKSSTSATAFASTALPHDLSKNSNVIHRVRLFIQKQQDLQRPRGYAYGTTNNSTILSALDAAAAVGVHPPASNVSARRWKWAYMIQKYATPLLHLFDRYKPPNSSLNVYCMWWKALSGNDKSSPVFDNELSYDLLPRVSRQIIKWFAKLFPRLHHANVEIRTAFLDQAISNCVIEERSRSDDPVRFRLVTFGAGYDIRSIKLKERGLIDEAIELDLPNVVDAKQLLLLSNRFKRRRPTTTQLHLPKQLYRVDLNNVTSVQNILDEILSVQSSNGVRYHTIFVFEAVLIYLNDGIPHSLLKACSNSLRNNKVDGSLCFADRLENVPGGNYSLAMNEMSTTGWSLVQWLPKPGLARHMGRAKLLQL
jgi:Leucine carboxyl methyltransferase